MSKNFCAADDTKLEIPIVYHSKNLGFDAETEHRKDCVHLP